jgi:diguanylate cyclase (GGDEF)-like protein
MERMRRLSVRSRLRMSYLALAGLTALVGGVGAYFTFSVSAEYKRIAQSTAPAMTALGYVKSHAIQLVGHVGNAVDDLEAERARFDNEAFGSSRERLEAWTDRYAQVAVDSQRRQYAGVIDANAERICAQSETILALAGTAAAKAMLDAELRHLEQTKATLVRTVDSAIQTEVRTLAHGTSAVEDVVMLAMFLGFSEAFVAIVMAFSLGAHISSSISRPVRHLIDASERLGQGRFETRIPIDGPSDLAQISAGFNAMAEQLEVLDQESERKNLQLEEKIGLLLDAEAKLRFEATHDALTGLTNRVLLEAHLEDCIERNRRDPSYNFAVLFFDLDRFKMVNDSLGHHIGDLLIVEAARRLQGSVRSLDTVVLVERRTTARFGGDEFAVLLDGISNPRRVVLIAERIQQMICRPFQLRGHEIQVSTSIGIALSTGRYEKAGDMLRDADIAMYRAKVAGGAQYAVFDDNMHAEARERLRIENDLRRAVTEHQFQIRYQPIVDLESDEVIAFEALIRWLHPEDGLIEPSMFVPVAEETGLIVPIGRWILRNACKQLKAWKDKLPPDRKLGISVNVSPRQVEGVDLAGEVRAVLEETGVSAHDLRLEITESMLMEKTDGIQRVLGDVRAVGCELHMDDFGTGYSSLSALHNFPLDVLKIDREFVSNVSTDPDYAAVVRAIMTLAHSLRMRVTAEGLETPHQVALVRSLGCNYGQGYIFAKPLEPAQAWELLNQGKMERQSA